MSKVCEICGKKPMIGNMVSHSKNATKRRFMPNLKNIRIKKKHKINKCLHEMP